MCIPMVNNISAPPLSITKVMHSNLDSYNKKYQAIWALEERLRQFYEDTKGAKILVTSSFGTTSAVLLDLIAKVNPTQKIHFIDTTYHFQATWDYKQALEEKLGLEVITIRGDEKLNQFSSDTQLWQSNNQICCHINKVQPLTEIRQGYDFWISGLMGHQNEHRKTLSFLQPKKGLLKFYPLLDISEGEANLYLKINNLPEHPLLEKGYCSIGCTHCTAPGTGRAGRWQNSTKTECGLHV